MEARSAIRDRLAAVRGDDPEFRWRGHHVSRLEGLSDAVFGFAITLLVVSLEVPQTFTELLATMRGFGAFAASFAILYWVWVSQYRFFRRYGLEDGITLVLNGVLLFVVLFFVYPLKFVFSLMFNGMMGVNTQVRLPDGRLETSLLPGQVPELFVVYGLGFSTVLVVLALLFAHAYRQRAALELTPVEAFLTRAGIGEHAVAASVGLISIAVALVVRPEHAGVAGLVYFLLAPAMTVNGMRTGRARQRRFGSVSGTPSGTSTSAATSVESDR